MELPHNYGDDVHFLDEPYLFSLLARIGSPETGTAAVPNLVRSAYIRLTHWVLSQEFPTVESRMQTRMAATEPRGFYEGPHLCQNTKLVFCSVIRAGIHPSQTCYETAIEVLPPENVRLDFLNMSRVTDDNGHVTGVRMEGSKIGGPVNDAVVVVADPMGATGGTIQRVVETYNMVNGGPPLAVIALHMMITPEAVQRILESCPNTKIYSGRFDRGLSSDEVLATPPGTHPERERGLNDVQYIVPGAGGMGELLTNSWV